MVSPLSSSFRARPCGLHDHPNNESAAVWWFPTTPRGCPVTLQGGLSLGVEDFPTDKTTARRLLERFQGPSASRNKEQIRRVVQTLQEMKHHLELVDRPSVTDSVAGPLLCALTLGATKSRRKKAIKLKKRRYEQIVKHFGQEMEVFGFTTEIKWKMNAPREEMVGVYGYETFDEHWVSPSIIFKPVRAQNRIVMAMEGVLGKKERSTSSHSTQANNNTDRAWEFVDTVLILQNRLHKRDEAYRQLRVIKSDDLFAYAKRFFDQQELYQMDSSASCSVDIGYHYTQEENLSRIKTGGLLSRADLETNRIAAITNGSSYGDGVYTADNPFAYHDMHYGDAGILVARLGGTIKVTEETEDSANYPPPFDHDALRVLRGDARVNMTILRKSSQCLALAYFDGRILDKTDASAPGNRAINKFHMELQLIIDRFLNGGMPSDVHLEAPFRTVITNPVRPKKYRSSRNQAPGNTNPTTSSSTIPSSPTMTMTPHIAGSSKSRAKPNTTSGTGGPTYEESVISYEAPETLDGLEFEDGVNIGAWNEGISDTTCPVCFLSFENDTQDVATINHCGHTFHESCLRQAISFMGSRCPLCRVVISEPVGRMPSGTMRIAVDPNMTCGGFPKGTIVISYTIPSGYQKEYHGNPGEKYNSTERRAFLPLVEEGLELLLRLKYAFRHGLTFDVGTSLTTGKMNVVVWTSIHHKTSLSGGAHGWPDPAYFLNCNEELDALGVPQPEELE